MPRAEARRLPAVEPPPGRAGGFSTALRSRIKQFKRSIFREHELLPLDAEEIQLLIDAGKSDWKDVEPAILGTLLERVLPAYKLRECSRGPAHALRAGVADQRSHGWRSAGSSE